MKIVIALLGVVFWTLFSVANATEMQDVSTLQHEWAKTQYLLEGKEQIKAYEALIEKANTMVEASPESAAILSWRGIINSAYAGVKGGLGAMKYAKAAKADLEKSIKLNANVLSGSASLSLGILYFKVPGWPIGFGDDDKAKSFLEKALATSPEGIDSNYFYADFLVDQGDYKEAEKYLLKAQQAPARPERPIADKGRQKEIAVLLAKVQQNSQAKNNNKLF